MGTAYSQDSQDSQDSRDRVMATRDEGLTTAQVARRGDGRPDRP